MAIIVCVFTVHAIAQVDEIKSSSSSHSSKESSGNNTPDASGGFVGDFFFQVMFSGIIQLQQQKLQRKQELPSIISLDFLLQGAAQPSSYYIVNPRIRVNWGLFSSDFRLNYVLEEGIDGVKYLRTNDWQILQFNIVTTRNVTARIGGGIIQESFGEKNNYPEWTGAVHIRPSLSKFGGYAEFRGSQARKEVNAYLQYSVLEKNRFHGSITGGAVFQRYYDHVNVWGFQGGFAFSIY